MKHKVNRVISFNMSNKRMADILYAGIMTDSEFSMMWSLSGNNYSRTQNSRNGADILIKIEFTKVEEFEKLSGCKLKIPQTVNGQ